MSDIATETAPTSDTLLTPAELVARWKNRITERTLANWRYDSEGPQWTKIGARVFYSLDAILAYERRRTMGPRP